MNALAEALEAVERALADTVADAFDSDELRGAGDADLLTVMAVAGRIVRHAEAVLIEGTGHVQERSDGLERDGKITTRMGCRSAGELVQRATLASRQTVADYERAARGIARAIAPSSGQRLPAEFPAMREALIEGAVGVDGLVAVLAPLGSIIGRAGRSALLAADEEFAAAARGEGGDAGPPAPAEYLRALAQVWSVYLDQDGAEPRDSRAARKRGFFLGMGRDGLVPVRGRLLPDVAAQLQRIFDALLNPKNDGPRFADTDLFSSDPDSDAAYREETADIRTRGQKQHDALATALTVAARAGELPTIGGAAPTLVVSAREEDVASGRGYAHVDGCDEPVPIDVARQVACTGAIQRVVTAEGGRIVSIGIADRVFNHHQRRAITLRDGGCIIPGCHVPASWCEIHHVDDHARGGPTHTDNGVLLCWWHHRSLDTEHWRVRMNRGVPEVRGPYWWDVHLEWRPATKSPTRMVDRLARRQ